MAVIERTRTRTITCKDCGKSEERAAAGPRPERCLACGSAHYRSDNRKRIRRIREMQT